MAPKGHVPDPVLLDRLAQALAHRGPDGQGRYVRDNVGLVQTRLAIIDLEGGRQPIFDKAGRAIVANGEIYNYKELRGVLENIEFSTGSDCEPPLHLYGRKSLGFVDDLRGMYALAIHDPDQGRLILARDPFGIKPLYVAEGDFGLAFASEPQALVKAGLVQAELDPQALAELLQLQFTCSSDTIYRHIRRIPCGQVLVARDGQIQETRHQDCLPAPMLVQGAENQLVERLDRILVQSVEMHQRADVPYGMFLSGGIDSSVLLSLMARLNPQPVLAFTAGFPGTSAHDERDHARHLAKQTGAIHHEVLFEQDDFWSLLPQVAQVMDDPAADYACLPTFKLARTAQAQVKVILAGEGGDELFGGYGRYRGAMRPWPLTRAMRRKGTFDGLDVLRPGALSGWRDRFALAERQARTLGRSRLQAAQALDCADWLPNDLLIKADRCLMANGIEGRVPFLDREVARFAFCLPDGWKIKNGLGKHLLRVWLDKHLPQAQAFARKRGFSVPVGDWIAAKPQLGPLVARQPAIAAIADPGKVKALFRRADQTGFACWTLLFYALWHRAHIDGRTMQGDVFECLSD